MSLRILLVDDSATVRLRYQVTLEADGYEVVTAGDGSEAMAKLDEDHGFHLVITDLNMPGLDGHDLIQSIRSSNRMRLLPVLMLTASSDRADLLTNLRAGASDFFRKAGDTSEFLARVENLARVGQLQDELERASRTDALTGLSNRRHGMAELDRQVAASQATGTALSVALLDIDHFKRFNDTYGHAAGDEVLIAVAELLRSSTRQSDCVVRWGGEEFLVVLPGLPRSGAAMRMRGLLAALAQRTFTIGAERTEVRVTASCGVAACAPGMTVDALVDRADQFLYRAKEQGRNQVVSAHSAAALPAA